MLFFKDWLAPFSGMFWHGAPKSQRMEPLLTNRNVIVRERSDTPNLARYGKTGTVCKLVPVMQGKLKDSRRQITFDYTMQD